MVAVRYVAVVDTPSIKQFVFATDVLQEIRGASALLDRLNRVELPEMIQKAAADLGGSASVVFSAGGAGQFIIEGLNEDQVVTVLNKAARLFAEKSEWELRLVAGYAPWEDGSLYQTAVRRAFGMLQRVRDWAAPRHSVLTAPILRECDSLSHVPASFHEEEEEWVSRATRLKREEATRVRTLRAAAGGVGPFVSWYQWLGRKLGRDVAVQAPDDFRGIGNALESGGHIAVVYCDGNNMGRLVQELQSPEVAKAFSEIVDSSVREACLKALYEVVYLPHVQGRAKSEQGGASERGSGAESEGTVSSDEVAEITTVPFDILLLGGDDVVVAIPARAALPFALKVLEYFETESRKRITEATGEVRSFFEGKLKDKPLSLCAGVAVARASYPFYLILELAEDLLKSAKAGATQERIGSGEKYATPSYLDFQWIEGGASFRLEDLRTIDYQVCECGVQVGDRMVWEARRTCRPYSLTRARELLKQAATLARIPSSKRHALWEAALEPRVLEAELKLQQLLGRLSSRTGGGVSEQVAWWNALGCLVPPGWEFDYPWYRRSEEKDGKSGVRLMTAAADLLEVVEYLPPNAGKKSGEQPDRS